LKAVTIRFAQKRLFLFLSDTDNKKPIINKMIIGIKQTGNHLTKV